MIRTLQKKFIITAMTAVTVLLLVVVAAISGIFTLQMYREVRWTAEFMVRDDPAMNGGNPAMPGGDLYGPGGDARMSDIAADGQSTDVQETDQGTGDYDDDLPGSDTMGPAVPGRERRGWIGGREFTRDNAMSVRFFVVRFDDSGEISETQTDRILSVDEDEAQQIARDIYDSGRTQGLRSGMYYYYVSDSDSGKDIICEDISSQAASVLSVLVISLGIAAISWVCMLLLVIALSKRAIVPIAQNIERQKQFVTNAGHEIKTPLAIILANTEALELYNGESKWTRNIRSQTHRLSGLMHNLLTLSRMDEPDLVLETEMFDLGALAGETAQPFQEPAANKGIALDVRTEELKVRANRESIRQLISILLDNAVKYTPQGGEILVETVRKGKKAALRVSNTVTQEQMEEDPERLFDRFYRSDKARTQKSGGYGIGLSAAKAIAAANKAEMKAFYEGKESIVFEVMLML